MGCSGGGPPVAARIEPAGRKVFCVKFQKEMPGLSEVPFDGHPLGQKVYENVSKEGWSMWLEHMKMIMNEYRLIVTGLNLLKTASDLTTRIRESLGERDVKLDEVVARIIEIQGLISDGRTALIDAQEQLLEKNRTILALEQDSRTLQEQLSKKQQGRVHDNAAWKVLDDDTEERPGCRAD